MKTIIMALSLIMTISSLCYAQCGKKFTITSSKTIHLDSGGHITRTDSEKAVVAIGPKDISIIVNDDHKMTGTIQSDSCNWPVAYKEGKSIIKALMDDESGNEKNVTITITGKDSKITLLFEVEDQPDDRIQVTADTFEETA